MMAAAAPHLRTTAKGRASACAPLNHRRTENASSPGGPPLALHQPQRASLHRGVRFCRRPSLRRRTGREGTFCRGARNGLRGVAVPLSKKAQKGGKQARYLPGGTRLLPPGASARLGEGVRGGTQAAGPCVCCWRCSFFSRIVRLTKVWCTHPTHDGMSVYSVGGRSLGMVRCTFVGRQRDCAPAAGHDHGRLTMGAKRSVVVVPKRFAQRG